MTSNESAARAPDPSDVASRVDGARVEARSITKRYGAAIALSDVSVTIEPGTIHALVGENGAGKSTLGKVIAGAVAPNSGEIVVDGVSVRYRSPRDAIQYGIAIIDQELAMVPTMSAVDNVFLGSELGANGVLNRSAQRSTYRELASRLALTADPDANAGRLRVADQQKIEIMRALVRNARLIVMDEPTAALTRDEGQRLLDITRELAATGVTIVFVSHRLDDVLALCDTITVLKDGQLVHTVGAADQTPDALVTAMIGRSLDLQFPPKAPPPADAPVLLQVRALARPPAFMDVSFEIRAGEIVGLAGLVGSGRTEIARAVFGADSGTGVVTLDGTELRSRSPRGRIRRGLAMLPESRKDQGLVMMRPVNENTTMAHMHTIVTRFGINRALERRVVGDAMERVDVRAASQTMPVRSLSGGNQQKVSLAKWLVETPRVLLADEPTRGIDVGAKRGIYEMLHRLAVEGMGVLLISSEIEEVLGLAHRILVVREGRIVAEFAGDADEATVMRAAFGSVDHQTVGDQA
jgi:simple sugar transport system ATP-binding protein/ribose transport system ATP-binding protein